MTFSVLKKCQKIGEGVFGEVFLNELRGRNSYVLKIIPIEGTEEINGAQQKRFDEILQEVIISQELSALRHTERNCSSGFVKVLNVRLVEGRYPANLLDLWNDFDTRQNSENDSPEVFGDDQLYVVFELANCGVDLEAHSFKNAEQSFSVFKQVSNIKTQSHLTLFVNSFLLRLNYILFCLMLVFFVSSVAALAKVIICFILWFLRRMSVSLVHNHLNI